MLNNLSGIDLLVLILLLLLMPTAGILASLRKKNPEQYFMAGRSLRWWMVAGSVFGTNINSSHLIGMLGIGYSIGFAQSHYEILAIAAILLLAYVFLPAYRNRKVFTLSQYLEHRYNERARLVYTVLMILLILVQMVAAFYIGSRTLGLLFRGSSFEITYWQGIVLIGLMTCSYTLFGGLGAVVVTDTLQTLMMLIAGIIVAVLTFSQPEIGGFSGLLELERELPDAARKMHLYLPTDHPDLPWSGAFTGLIILHLFYWTTNQYLVQRTLAARTDREARIGIIASGMLKLTIPFFSVACGVAAAYVFQNRFGNQSVLPDDAFLRLVETVVPIGYGLTGFILAGLTAATFSSIDSMMNSATTLVTLDIYQKYVHPSATEGQLVRTGRLMVVVMVALSAGLALLTYDPDSAGNFFLSVSSRGSYLTPGIVAAFFVGIFWRKSNGRAAVITMLAAPLFSVGVEWLYAGYLSTIPAIRDVLGTQLNFLHRVLLTLLFCIFVQLLLSRLWNRHQPVSVHADDIEIVSLPDILGWVAAFVSIHAVFLLLITFGDIPASALSLLAALASLSLFTYAILKAPRPDSPASFPAVLLRDDRLYAGLLTAAGVWMLYYFA